MDAICTSNTEQTSAQEACDRLSVRALVRMAPKKGGAVRLLDQRNNGDTSGVLGGVASNSAANLHDRGMETLTAAERAQLLGLARRTLEEVATHGQLPEIDEQAMPEKFRKPGMCFVTLTIAGELRGCIGNLIPRGTLCRAVMLNTESAATRDFRFSPVAPTEVKKIRIEISVLTEPRPLSFDSADALLDQVRPHTDGILLKLGSCSATYLPQVWSKIPDKVAFLNSLARKAGCEPSAWRDPGASVAVYQVESFEEENGH